MAAVGDGSDTLTNVEQLRFADQVVALTPPAAPINVSALALNASALVTWTEPAGGAAVSSFDVQVFAGANLVKTVSVPRTDSSAIITGLANGTAVTFKVRANSIGGSSVSSPSAPVTPQAPANTAPGAPTIGTATAAVGGASVTWTAPASNGGAAITSYKVEVLNAANTVIRTVTVTAPATSTLVTGLTAGTVVRLRVSATNSVGTGSASGNSNAVTVIGDLVAPTVSARTPANAATNVAVNSLATATFSEPVQGVSNSTFTLRIGAGAPIAATVSLNAAGTVATLTPSAPLANGTQYTATLTGGASAIRDLAGNALATSTWTFRTVADTTAPTVTSRVPGPGATGVGRNANVVVTFSEPVTNVTTTTFTLTNQAGVRVAAAVTLSANGRTATLNPNATLANARRFHVDLTNGIRDTAGNRLTAIAWNYFT